MGQKHLWSINRPTEAFVNAVIPVLSTTARARFMSCGGTRSPVRTTCISQHPRTAGRLSARLPSSGVGHLAAESLPDGRGCSRRNCSRQNSPPCGGVRSRSFLRLKVSEERLLGPGEQAWIATTENGPFVIWLAKRGDAAYLLTPNSKSPRKLANNATDPVLATGPAGQGPVVAAWESRSGANHTIQFQSIEQ